MRRRRAAVSWGLAIAAAIALAAGCLLAYADRALFDSEGFADRAAAALDTPAVRDEVAGRLTGAALAARPDLVALQPLVELAARSAVGAPQFRWLVRRAALDAHRAAFDEDSRTVTVRVRDAGVLLAAALQRLSPESAARIPTSVVTPVARVRGTIDRFLLRLAERADGVRRAKWIAFAAALALALGALLTGGSRRGSVVRLGTAAAAVGLVVALGAAAAPRLVAGDPAVRAALAVWLDPVRNWAAAAAAIGALTALAAAAVVRPLPVTAVLRRLRAFVAAAPRNRGERGMRAAAAVALGAAMVAWPRATLTAAIVGAGVVVLAVGFAELLALAAGESRAGRPLTAGAGDEPAGHGREGVPPARGGGRRGVRVALVAALLAAGAALTAVVASGDAPPAPHAGRCNGRAALCDRRLDQVALLGTHNSMSAAGEPGWLFAAQDAGISRQLADGVRALLIDTHYGVATSRGVVTELGGKSRGKLVAEVGEPVVATAERLRRRVGRNPAGKREVFLCHTFCEVGATRALTALRDVHRFLVLHPQEVVVLSIQDETTAEDTAKLIRDSGLADEVYRGRAGAPWPTLSELIERDERVVVLAENHTGAAPWVHPQAAVAQETPYRFRTVAALAAGDSCVPHRGGTAGSLLLVNHWVDTSPAPRVTIAREVNAHDFLSRRLALCRRTRHLLPNIVAVDFWRQGAAARVVDELNG